MLVEFKMFFLIGGIFFKLGANGENVLVEFENVFLIGGIFFKLGAKIILGSRKSAILGIIWTPEDKWWKLVYAV